MTVSAQIFDETQHPRDPSGQFTTKPASESSAELGGASGTDRHEQDRHELAALQELTADPTTGASPALWRYYSWHDAETGDFAAWSEDLTNTPPERLSDEAMADWATVRDGLDSGADPAQIADRVQPGDERLADSIARLARVAGSRSGDDPLPEGLHAVVAERRAHEQAGGAIVSDMHSGEVFWRADDSDTAPLFRACKDPGGAPAQFREDGSPAVWTRGSDVVRHVSLDGTDTRFDPGTGNAVHESRPDGSFTHYDPEHAWDVHRDPSEGPARFDDDGAAWIRGGDMYRDPDEGPAWIGYDGHVRYHDATGEVEPTAEQMERHGVEAVQAPSPHGAIDPGYVRYQVKGSTVSEPFDLTGHPLDHGLRLERQEVTA